MKLLLTCAIVATAVSAAQAQTVTVLQTGFEPGEGYAPGNLNGQNGWFLHFGEDPNFGRVTAVNPLAGSQSVLLDGQDVLLGTFNNYAGIGHAANIAPTLGGAPLRFVETTGLCAIVDPTPVAGHYSVGWLAQYNGVFSVTAVGAATLNTQYLFGWAASSGTMALPVQPSATFQFRQVTDYHTGNVTTWLNGQLVYHVVSPMLFNSSVYATEVYFQGVSPDAQPFDTRVWYDNIHIRAMYGSCAADITGDANANVDDLLAVISAWGPCPGGPASCPANIVNTGTSAGRVDVDDLLAVISGWGPCT